MATGPDRRPKGCLAHVCFGVRQRKVASARSSRGSGSVRPQTRVTPVLDKVPLDEELALRASRVQLLSATQTHLDTSNIRLRNKAGCFVDQSSWSFIFGKIKGERSSGHYQNELICCRPFATAPESSLKSVQNFSSGFANRQINKQTNLQSHDRLA